MKHHPDRVASGEKDAAEAKFKEITEAYEVLRDPERRATYDRYGEAGLKRGAGAGTGGFAPFDLSEALNIFMRDFGGLGGFDAFFGGSERAQRERHRGQDLKVTPKLRLAQGASGTTQKVKGRAIERCTARGNGPAGDLIAVLDIAEDPRFERQGDDLIYDVPVSFTQAALGAEVGIPTPYGDTNLAIAPGTQTGAVYRLRGKGLPRVGEGGRGDLHVRVHVWTPVKLTAEQRALLEQLAKIESKPPAEGHTGKKFWEQLRQAFGR